MTVRILLADDHAVVRNGLRVLLESAGLKIAGEASNGQEAVALVRTLRPDVAILDVSMPLLNGLDAARELKWSLPDVKVVLLTRHDEPQYVSEAFRCGVRGYVLKRQAATDLVQAIREVVAGKSYLSPDVAAATSQQGSRPDPDRHMLTPRELQVLQMVGEGQSTKDVARVLGISTKTAESHRARLMRKLDIHETASLVRYAIRCGLVRP